MKILVAGGAGFIGSNLCELLLRSGHKVICVDNFITGKLANIAKYTTNSDFEIRKRDVCGLQPFKENIDCVVHLASPASPVKYMVNSSYTIEANTIGTKSLIDYANANNARFIFASTSEVYGDPLEHPQEESYYGNVNTVGPRSCYDESKRLGETITYNGIDNHCILRIFNTYGPRMDLYDGRLIPEIIRCYKLDTEFTVHGAGSQTRSLCYIDDLIEGILFAIHSTATGVFNIGNPEELTINQIIQEMENIYGRSLRKINVGSRFNDPMKRCPDIYKITSRMGWIPKVDLSTGLRRTVKFYEPDC